jgi:hypothetical protein
MQQAWEPEREWELQAHLSADLVACHVHQEMAAGQETFLVASGLAEDTKALLQPEEDMLDTALVLALAPSFRHCQQPLVQCLLQSLEVKGMAFQSKMYYIP